MHLKLLQLNSIKYKLKNFRKVKKMTKQLILSLQNKNELYEALELNKKNNYEFKLLPEHNLVNVECLSILSLNNYEMKCYENKKVVFVYKRRVQQWNK